MTAVSRYQRLAAYARDAGSDRATPATIQGWCRAGLLPAARIERPGFGVRTSIEEPPTYAQLLELCRLRWKRGLRWHRQLAIHLWVAGFRIEPETARRALRFTVDELPRYLRRYHHVVGDAAELEAVEAALEDWALAASKPGTDESRDLLFRGLLDFARLILGLPVSEPDVAALGHIESMLHMDRARTDVLGDAMPWLEAAAPGAALIEAAAHVNVATLTSAVESASGDDLEAARRFASRLIDVWSVVGRVLDHLPPGFAGLDLFAAALTSPDGPALLAVMALVLPADSNAFIDHLTTELDAEDLKEGLATLEAEPELAAVVRSALASKVRQR